MQKVLLFGRLVKVSSQTCRQITCKYNAIILPKVFPKLTTSDTNALEGDFLSGRGWRLPPGFRITRNIKQDFNLHFLKFFVQTTKNPVGHEALLLSAECMVVLWLMVQEHVLVISLMLIPLSLAYFVVYFCSGSVDLLEPFGVLLI